MKLFKQVFPNVIKIINTANTISIIIFTPAGKVGNKATRLSMPPKILPNIILLSDVLI